MPQIIKIKNDTGSIKIWAGKEFAAAEEHTIQESSISKWRSNNALLTAIGNSDALVGDSSSYFTDISKAFNWLNGDIATIISSPFPANDSAYSFRGLGGSAALSTGSNNVDQVITAARFINGAEVWSDDPAYGNSITFQVVDVDNVLGYGAGTVIEEFGTTWQMHPGCITKAFPGYIASVPAGLYVRMVVTVSQAASFHYNLHLHKQ